MSGLLGLPARHDAIPSNPVRDVARINSPSEIRRSLDVGDHLGGDRRPGRRPRSPGDGGPPHGKGLVVQPKPKSRAGHGDITSHTFRRSVATLMDRAGLSARAAADQLGHARVSMTTDRYFGRQLASTGAAGLLEAVGRTEAEK
jgi:integrase